MEGEKSREGKAGVAALYPIVYTNKCDSNPRISGVSSQARRKLSSIAGNVVLFNILQVSVFSHILCQPFGSVVL